MKLYYSPGACSFAVHVTALEADIDLTLVRVDLVTHKTADGGDFFAINPRGFVPALQLDDDTVLTEVSAILQYLGDLQPSKGLTPAAGTMPRVRLQEWLSFIATELHKPFGAVWSHEMPEAAKKLFIDRIHVRAAELERVLARQPHLLGESFTVADAYAFTVMGWARFMGISLDKHPALNAYLGRLSTRPSVLKALGAEGLLKN